MWWQPVWQFIQQYWSILLLALVSLIFAVPMAQEIQYKYKQTIFTRMLQILLVIIFSMVILGILLIITAIL